MRYSVGMIIGEKDDAEADAWADALLDSGSVDQVTLNSNAMNLYTPGGLETLPGVQLLIVDLKGGTSVPQFSVPWDIAELTPERMERKALTGTQVRSVTETWPKARVLSGRPQLAGVAVLKSRLDEDLFGTGGAQALAEPSGPIKDSKECAYTFPEHACPKQTEPLSRVDKGHWLLLCGLRSTTPNRLVIGASNASGEPFSTGYLYQVRASANAKGACGDPESDHETRFRAYPAEGAQNPTSISLEVLPDAFGESDDMYFCVTANKGTASRVSGRIHVKRLCK